MCAKVTSNYCELTRPPKQNDVKMNMLLRTQFVKLSGIRTRDEERFSRRTWLNQLRLVAGSLDVLYKLVPIAKRKHRFIEERCKLGFREFQTRSFDDIERESWIRNWANTVRARRCDLHNCRARLSCYVSRVTPKAVWIFQSRMSLEAREERHRETTFSRDLSLISIRRRLRQCTLGLNAACHPRNGEEEKASTSMAVFAVSLLHNCWLRRTINSGRCLHKISSVNRCLSGWWLAILGLYGITWDWPLNSAPFPRLFRSIARRKLN